jgi:hypothetical protein
MGPGPLAADKIPVPAQQGVGLHEEPAQTPAVEQSAQPGEEGTIRRQQGRSDYLTAKHGDFVTKYDDLNSQFTVVASAEAQQLEDSDEGEVEKR